MLASGILGSVGAIVVACVVLLVVLPKLVSNQKGSSLRIPPGVDRQLSARYFELVNEMARSYIYLPDGVVRWIQDPEGVRTVKRCAFVLMEARRYNPDHSANDLFDATLAKMEPGLIAKSGSREAALFTMTFAAHVAEMPDIARAVRRRMPTVEAG